jgi:hypothetical protein
MPTIDMDEELARLKREQRVERAMSIYLSTPCGAGLGHGAIMGLGRRLQNAGLDHSEIRWKLNEAIRSRPRPKSEVNEGMKTLGRPFRR